MRIAAALLLVQVLSVPTAGAAPDDRRAEAAKLVDRGAAEFDRHQYQDSLASFRRALELYSSPKIHLNLGYVYEKLGQWRAAAEEADRFLADRTGNTPAEIVVEARKLQARASRRLGRLPAVLELGHDPPAAVAEPPVEAPPPVAAPPPESAPARLAPPPPPPPVPALIVSAPSARGLPATERRVLIGSGVLAGVLWLGVVGTGAGAIVEHQRFVDPSNEQADSARRTGFSLAVTNDVLLAAAAVATAATVGYALWSRYHR